MNLERLRNLLKTTQLENSRVKNRSYFESLVLSTTPYCRRTWLKSTDCLLSISLSLFFFFGPNRRYWVSRSKFLFRDLYTIVHRYLSQKSCSVLWRLKKKNNPQWIRGSPEEVSLKSSLSEANGGLRGYPSVSHSLLFGLCALGERVERTLGWVGWRGFQSAGFNLAVNFNFESQFSHL